jgi:hypothetical protein
MINPTLNPYAASLVAMNNPASVAAAPPAQAVTPRPALPAHKNELRSRDRRNREEPEKKTKGQRGAGTDLTV